MERIGRFRSRIRVPAPSPGPAPGAVLGILQPAESRQTQILKMEMSPLALTARFAKRARGSANSVRNGPTNSMKRA